MLFVLEMKHFGLWKPLQPIKCSTVLMFSYGRDGGLPETWDRPFLPGRSRVAPLSLYCSPWPKGHTLIPSCFCENAVHSRRCLNAENIWVGALGNHRTVLIMHAATNQKIDCNEMPGAWPITTTAKPTNMQPSPCAAITHPTSAFRDDSIGQPSTKRGTILIRPPGSPIARGQDATKLAAESGRRPLPKLGRRSPEHHTTLSRPRPLRPVAYRGPTSTAINATCRNGQFCCAHVSAGLSCHASRRSVGLWLRCSTALR